MIAGPGYRDSPVIAHLQAALLIIPATACHRPSIDTAVRNNQTSTSSATPHDS